MCIRDSLNSSMLEGWKMDPDIPKEGKLQDVVSASQSVLVQIAKEPISTKGPRLTAEVTLAGRYMVLVPFINKVSISTRIKDEDERRRLKELMPVSYTHLDVYKRQMRRRSCAARPSTRSRPWRRPQLSPRPPTSILSLIHI